MHQVLVCLVALYVHSQPVASTNTAIRIPEPLAVPLLQVSSMIKAPPVVTYSDIGLHNWSLIDPAKPVSLDNIQTHVMFGTFPEDEKAFYKISMLVELKGAEALAIIHKAEEVFTRAPTNTNEVLIELLDKLVDVLKEQIQIFETLKSQCDPNAFYDYIRPWFRGSNLKPDGTLYWEFDTGGCQFDLSFQNNMAGATAGQSSLFNAIDIFLGIDKETHAIGGGVEGSGKLSFLDQMRPYMPIRHQSYLDRLATTRTRLRDYVKTSAGSGSKELKAAYNRAVNGLKEFRNQHIRFVTLYIVSPARRQRRDLSSSSSRGLDEFGKGKEGEVEVTGTGGSDAIPALKAIRNSNANATL